MGFIMTKGQGTDEIIDKLAKKFAGNTRLTAADLAWLRPDGPGKGSLLAAAEPNALNIMPTAHPNKWRKWLRWIEKHHKAAHDEIRDTLYNNLSAISPVPTLCNWIEDSRANRPRVDPRTYSDPGGARFATLTVLTKKVDDLPDETATAGMRKAAKKKAAKKKKSKKKA